MSTYDENETEKQPLSWYEEYQTISKALFNERKAILFPNLTVEDLETRIHKLLDLHTEHLDELFQLDTQTGALTFDSSASDKFFEIQKFILSLQLMKIDASAEPSHSSDSLSPTSPSAEQDTALPREESIVDFISDDDDDILVVKDETTSKIIREQEQEQAFNTHLIPDLDRVIPLLIKALTTDQISSSSVVSTIQAIKNVKIHIFLLSMLRFSFSGDIPDGFESFSRSLTREELFMILNKIVPKAYDCNFHKIYFSPFLTRFFESFQSSQYRDTFKSVLETVERRFSPFLDTYATRHKKLIHDFGWATWNLEDCCDRVETRAGVLLAESPIENCEKMLQLWYLLDASRFVTIDNISLTVHCFSADLPVYYEQLMRIFFILNRIDESIGDIGYDAYATPEFVSIYVCIYVELHSLFNDLVNALYKNYEVQELVLDSDSGRVSKLPFDSSTVIKLRELSIYMTLPLGLLDSNLRFSLAENDLPALFNDETERFLFTVPIINRLQLHEFVSNDRQKFAEHVVDFYPCLDRHFSQYHKSKKTSSQSFNTTLPPSYFLFAKLPPTYVNINVSTPTQSSLDLYTPPTFNASVVEIEESKMLGCESICKIFIGSILIFIGLIIFINIIIYTWFCLVGWLDSNEKKQQQIKFKNINLR